MVQFPENCEYYTRSQVENEIISPKYPCMKCKFGLTGKVVDLIIPETFPSATIHNCIIDIEFCDLDFIDLQGADIRYDINVIPLTNFLNEKIFSCIKCIDGKIPVATLYHDITKKAFYYKKHDSLTFDLTTIAIEGSSVVCRDPTKSEEFGLSNGDSAFDLDINCSLAVIDLAQSKISSTKTDSRFFIKII